MAGIGQLIKIASGADFQKTIEDIVTETTAIKRDREGLKAALPRAFTHFNARLDRQDRLLAAICARLDVDVALAECAGAETAEPRQET